MQQTHDATLETKHDSSRRLTLLAIGVQMVAWLALIWGLYYRMSEYKIIFRDFNFQPSDDVLILIQVSDLLVIYTGSDEMFSIILVTFLVLLFGVNFAVIKSVKAKVSFYWCAFMLAIPVIAIVFAVHSLSPVVQRLAKERPEILDYGLWIIDVFAG